MSHNFIVTYINKRGAIDKEFVQNKSTIEDARNVVKLSGKVKEILSTHLCTED